MNIPIRKNVTLTINADATIQAVANVTGKSQGDIISEAVLTPKLLVTAGFDTSRAHPKSPVAHMIDMYRQTGDNMTMEKSLMLIKFTREFIRGNDIHFSTRKIANFAEFFLSCMSGLDSANGEKALMEFSPSVLELDLVRMQKDIDDGEAIINENLICNILNAMQSHIADRRVYANAFLFHLLVIALEECTESAAELQTNMKTALDTDISDEQAAELRPTPNWGHVYMAAAPVIGFIF